MNKRFVAIAVLAMSYTLPAFADEPKATTPPAKSEAASPHATDHSAKQEKKKSDMDGMPAQEGRAAAQAGGATAETKVDEMGMHAHHSVETPSAGTSKASSEVAKTPAGSAMTSSTNKPAAAVTYVCPMHPDVASNEKGRCPKCNMFLEPKNKQ